MMPVMTKLTTIIHNSYNSYNSSHNRWCFHIVVYVCAVMAASDVMAAGDVEVLKAELQQSLSHQSGTIDHQGAYPTSSRLEPVEVEQKIAKTSTKTSTKIKTGLPLGSRTKVSGVFRFQHFERIVAAAQTSSDKNMDSHVVQGLAGVKRDSSLAAKDGMSWGRLFLMTSDVAASALLSQVDGLVIDMWYVPSALKRAENVNVVAEVFSHPVTDNKKTWLKVYQMIAHLPGQSGHIQPLWVMSKDMKHLGHGLLSLLKMHVPAFDYVAL
ncbi:MAG: hypothetical protein OXC44_03040 [Proteobacteria bacterium]|nr:hypothetical protein [Pseudomonadota bacterium]